MRVNSADQTKTPASAALGFEAQLWEAADKIRGHMGAAENNPATRRLGKFGEADTLLSKLLNGELSVAEAKKN